MVEMVEMVVVFFCVVDQHYNTLSHFRHQKVHRAPSGQSGRSCACTGRQGAPLYLKVPIGTQVWNHSNDELIADLDTMGQSLCVARGGKAGLGNIHFKTSTNRARHVAVRWDPQVRSVFFALRA